ncbi:RING finger protein 151 [Syngnathoides biaculeatus]|uniref:RING finger protein 151 n=1 Tax=Syngnathoides biaculeatus TaxID=300417 RepID=UPI002ADDF8B1|nr:RING finger protein 151 [Syngnathoides biaculeatus]XP_061702888.1 RING finger protein 151 [Syngnathoides biaculeatus]XP_061702889.1 RING finger protein 151 [Syngnathoides biaculeatus]
MTDAEASSRSSGYDVERFVDAPDYDLICAICQGVLRCPVRAACRHVFCKKCILQWLKRQETCPCCRKAINACTIFVLFKLSKSIGRMRIKCKNEIRGCPATFPLSEQDCHSLNCSYEVVPCPHAGCRAQLLRRDLETHARRCEHWRQPCRMGCGAVLCPRTRAQHNCYMDLKRQYWARSRNHGAVAAALQRKMTRMQNAMAHVKRQIGLICESLRVMDELHKVDEDSGEGTSGTARTALSSDG